MRRTSRFPCLGPTTGNVIVTVSGLASNGVNFTVTAGAGTVSAPTFVQSADCSQLDGSARPRGARRVDLNAVFPSLLWAAPRGLDGGGFAQQTIPSQDYTVLDDTGNSYTYVTNLGENGQLLVFFYTVAAPRLYELPLPATRRSVSGCRGSQSSLVSADLTNRAPELRGPEHPLRRAARPQPLPENWLSSKPSMTT